MDNRSLKKAGVCEEDVSIILDACDKLKRSLWQRNPTLGMYTYFGNEASAHNVYQSAFILVEVPPWGDSPRKLADDLESPGPKKEKIVNEQEYRHIFDDDNKQLYCWK